jgi:hypothetical protein
MRRRKRKRNVREGGWGGRRAKEGREGRREGRNEGSEERGGDYQYHELVGKEDEAGTTRECGSQTVRTMAVMAMAMEAVMKAMMMMIDLMVMAMKDEEEEAWGGHGEKEESKRTRRE